MASASGARKTAPGATSTVDHFTRSALSSNDSPPPLPTSHSFLLPRSLITMTHRRRRLSILLLAFAACTRTRPAAAPPAGAQQERAPELRDLDLSSWDCLQREGGNAATEIDATRNLMKNRPWRAVTERVPDWSFEQFVDSARAFDAAIGGVKARRELTSAQAQTLAGIERRLVSVTAWIVMAYPTGRESTNCGSTEFIDWHIELVARPFDHRPAPGDPTAIITEITPRTERPLYRAGVRMQKLASIIRLCGPPNITAVTTGSPPHRVRVTGYLLWDDQHNGPNDIGPTVLTGGGSQYHNPWRISPWEIHPVLKIEDLGTRVPGG